MVILEWEALGYVLGIPGFSVLAVSHYFGKARKGPFFSHLTTLRHQNIKMSISQLNKNGWVLPFFGFLKPVREKS